MQFDQQPGSNFDISQLVNETIPQLQAQVNQLQIMLQNPSLPAHVRQTTQHQFQQTQMQLQQAQAFAALAADMSAAAAAQQLQQQQQQQQHQQQNVGNMTQTFPQNPWPASFPMQQPPIIDSAYQRLPVNNRRRNKRERPSDFLEIGTGEPPQSKMPKFWE